MTVLDKSNSCSKKKKRKSQYKSCLSCVHFCNLTVREQERTTLPFYFSVITQDVPLLKEINMLLQENDIEDTA